MRSPLEQLEKRLLEHPAARQFGAERRFRIDNVVLRVIYWSEKHQQELIQFFELVGDDDVLNMLPPGTIDTIVGKFNDAANEALAQGPPHEVVIGVRP